MQKLCLIVSACVLLAAWTNPTGAALTVVTFNNLPPTPFATYTESGVTFTAVGDGMLLQEISSVPGGTEPAISGAPFGTPTTYPAMRADIAGGARRVSVALGDWAEDEETLFLRVFDASDNMLGAPVELFSASNDMELHVLEAFAPADGPCISYAIFGGQDSSVNNGSSVSADNFAFEPCACPSVIPAPGAILLGAIGTGFVGCLRRRRAL